MSDPQEENIHQLAARVALALAQYEVTKNEVFLWESVEAMMNPSLDGRPVPLPEEVRRYLGAVAVKIRKAALQPSGDFLATARDALNLGSGASGKSKAEDYARDQSVGLLLRVFNEMKRRHGADQAYRLMSEAIGISVKSMMARLTAARSHEARLAELGITPLSALGAMDQDLPEEFLLQTMLRGLPNLFWTRGDGAKTMNPAQNGRSKKHL